MGNYASGMAINHPGESTLSMYLASAPTTKEKGGKNLKDTVRTNERGSHYKRGKLCVEGTIITHQHPWNAMGKEGL